MSEATPSPASPPAGARFRPSLDTWAVLLAAVLTVLVVLRVVPSVPW